MIDDSSMYEFAKSCASSYCRKHNVRRQFDDATHDAVVYLLEHREKWSQSNQTLKRRVVGELERQYQNVKGLRLSSPPKFLEADEPDRFTRPEPVEANRFSVAHAVAAIDSALMLAVVEEVKLFPDYQLEPTKSILDAALRGFYTRKEIASQYDMRTADVSRLVKKFKAACRRRYKKTIEAKYETLLFD